MNNTESWKKYVPETVSLYHVDYRENLDEREELQEQCIRNNNMERLYETVMECYAEQEAESLLKILGEIKEKMAEAGQTHYIFILFNSLNKYSSFHPAFFLLAATLPFVSSCLMI